MKKLLALVLAFVCSMSLLVGCGGDEASKSDSYKVTVKDALGNPYPSGIVVQFLQDGQQVAMQVCDATGVAEKDLDDGDYDVALMFTGGEDNYYYDATDLKVTASKKTLEITLSYKITEEPTSLYAQGEENDAYNVIEGSTYVNLNAGKRTYFLFSPTAAGAYEFSMVGADDASVGYYGMPHYVQETSASEIVDGKCVVDVNAGMVGASETSTSVWVIGVDSTTSTEGLLCIRRKGDAAWSVADEQWSQYQATAELSAYTVPGGAAIEEFDITASTDAYNLVYNEADGFYHLDSADGPLVLVRLTKNPKYVDCFETITSKTGVVKYFWKEEGKTDDKDNFIKKEDYTECLLNYYEFCDETHGVYPLTEDLKYIIQSFGDHQGWFDENNASMYLFLDEGGEKIPGVNPEISWLFMCCYIK